MLAGKGVRVTGIDISKLLRSTSIVACLFPRCRYFHPFYGRVRGRKKKYEREKCQWCGRKKSREIFSSPTILATSSREIEAVFCVCVIVGGSCKGV